METSRSVTRRSLRETPVPSVKKKRLLRQARQTHPQQRSGKNQIIGFQTG
jgi:hypothetical protein